MSASVVVGGGSPQKSETPVAAGVPEETHRIGNDAQPHFSTAATITLFLKLENVAGQRISMPWHALASRLVSTRAVTKDALPLFRGGLNAENTARKRSTIDNLSLVVIEHDAETVPLADAVAALSKAGLRCLLFTTASHTPHQPRWRAVLPLQRLVAPDAYPRIVRQLNELLDGAVSSECAEVTRRWFYGRADDAAEFLHERLDGECVDVVAAREQWPERPFTSTPKADGNATESDSRTGDELVEEIRAGAPGLNNAVLRLVAKRHCAGYSEDAIRAEMAALRADIERTRGAERARALFNGGELDRIIDGAVANLEVRTCPASVYEFDILPPENPPPPRPFKLRPANLDLREIRAIRWVIQGWVAAGEIVTFAGLPGVGKSTAFAGLALVVAGFGRAIGSNLRNDRPRRVVIVSEHAEQYQRLLHASIMRHGLDPDAVAGAVVLFDAVRLKTAEITREIAHLVDEQRTDSEPPLVILDTASALFALDDENSNAEVAATMAALKGTVTATGAAIWIVAHAAKAFSREDSDITPRGASAYMGDVHGTGSVFRDTNTPGSVFVKSIKNRSVAEFREIEAAMETITLEAVDERGVVQQLPVRIATPVVPFIDRAGRKAEARAAEAQDELALGKAFVAEFIDQRPDMNVSRRILEDERGELSREVTRQAIDSMVRRGDLIEEEIRPRPDKGSRHRLVLRELA